MGIKNLLGINEKGLDCQDDPQTGNKICRVMIRHKNNKFATGSSVNIAMDQNCKAHFTGTYSVFDDDEEIIQKTKSKMEADCRGGIN